MLRSYSKLVEDLVKVQSAVRKGEEPDRKKIAACDQLKPMVVAAAEQTPACPVAQAASRAGGRAASGQPVEAPDDHPPTPPRRSEN